jgi:hypothetical protein
MPPPSDWGQLCDGNADAGAAAVLPDPDEGEQGQRAMDGSRQIARLVTAKITLTYLSLSTNQMGDEALAVVASDVLN